jgi:hypothetical protein
MCIDFLPFAEILVPHTVGEHASIWAIRLAMMVLVMCLGLEIRGWPKTSPLLSNLWLFGAIAAFCHSLGALTTFHHGSHAEALKSTADQTQELLGVPIAAGLYFNYIFVATWFADAIWRIVAPMRYQRLPPAYHLVVTGFLVFIAFNGAVVFKTGPFRWAGIASVVVLGALWLLQKRTAEQHLNKLNTTAE